MGVEFHANVEEDYQGGWCIKLTDTMSQNMEVCKNLEDFSVAIEKMGEDYVGDIEVKWSKNDDVTDEHFYELHQQMAKVQQEFNEK